MEQIIIFLGNIWAGIVSAFVTFCATLFPYYWVYDEFDNTGRHLSGWWFALTLAVAVLAAHWVGYAVYQNYKDAMDRIQAKKMIEIATKEAHQIMKTKYNVKV